ncbi:hypothetical protein JDS88_06480 [Bacillus cereus]|nr:hypothetical protein [Bacillus cereus]
MGTFIFIVGLFSLIIILVLLLIGLISPDKGLFWLKNKEKSRILVVRIYSIMWIITGCIFINALPQGIYRNSLEVTFIFLMFISFVFLIIALIYPKIVFNGGKRLRLKTFLLFTAAILLFITCSQLAKPKYTAEELVKIEKYEKEKEEETKAVAKAEEKAKKEEEAKAEAEEKAKKEEEAKAEAEEKAKKEEEAKAEVEKKAKKEEETKAEAEEKAKKEEEAKAEEKAKKEEETKAEAEEKAKKEEEAKAEEKEKEKAKKEKEAKTIGGDLEPVNISVERTGGLLSGFGNVKVYIDGEQVMKVRNEQTESINLYLPSGTHEIQTKGQGDKSSVLKFEVVSGQDNTFNYHTEIGSIYGVELEKIR